MHTTHAHTLIYAHTHTLTCKHTKTHSFIVVRYQAVGAVGTHTHTHTYMLTHVCTHNTHTNISGWDGWNGYVVSSSALIRHFLGSFKALLGLF